MSNTRIQHNDTQPVTPESFPEDNAQTRPSVTSEPSNPDLAEDESKPTSAVSTTSSNANRMSTISKLAEAEARVTQIVKAMTRYFKDIELIQSDQVPLTSVAENAPDDEPSKLWVDVTELVFAAMVVAPINGSVKDSPSNSESIDEWYRSHIAHITTQAEQLVTEISRLRDSAAALAARLQDVPASKSNHAKVTSIVSELEVHIAKVRQHLGAQPVLPLHSSISNSVTNHFSAEVMNSQAAVTTYVSYLRLLLDSNGNASNPSQASSNGMTVGTTDLRYTDTKHETKDTQPLVSSDPDIALDSYLLERCMPVARALARQALVLSRYVQHDQKEPTATVNDVYSQLCSGLALLPLPVGAFLDDTNATEGIASSIAQIIARGPLGKFIRLQERFDTIAYDRLTEHRDSLGEGDATLEEITKSESKNGWKIVQYLMSSFNSDLQNLQSQANLVRGRLSGSSDSGHDAIVSSETFPGLPPLARMTTSTSTLAAVIESSGMDVPALRSPPTGHSASADSVSGSSATPLSSVSLRKGMRAIGEYYNTLYTRAQCLRAISKDFKVCAETSVQQIKTLKSWMSSTGLRLTAPITLNFSSNAVITNLQHAAVLENLRRSMEVGLPIISNYVTELARRAKVEQAMHEARKAVEIALMTWERAESMQQKRFTKRLSTRFSDVVVAGVDLQQLSVLPTALQEEVDTLKHTDQSETVSANSENSSELASAAFEKSLITLLSSVSTDTVDSMVKSYSLNSQDTKARRKVNPSRSEQIPRTSQRISKVRASASLPTPKSNARSIEDGVPIDPAKEPLSLLSTCQDQQDKSEPLQPLDLQNYMPPVPLFGTTPTQNNGPVATLTPGLSPQLGSRRWPLEQVTTDANNNAALSPGHVYQLTQQLLYQQQLCQQLATHLQTLQQQQQQQQQHQHPLPQQAKPLYPMAQTTSALDPQIRSQLGAALPPQYPQPISRSSSHTSGLTSADSPIAGAPTKMAASIATTTQSQPATTVAPTMSGSPHPYLLPGSLGMHTLPITPDPSYMVNFAGSPAILNHVNHPTQANVLPTGGFSPMASVGSGLPPMSPKHIAMGTTTALALLQKQQQHQQQQAQIQPQSPHPPQQPAGQSPSLTYISLPQNPPIPSQTLVSQQQYMQVQQQQQHQQLQMYQHLQQQQHQQSYHQSNSYMQSTPQPLVQGVRSVQFSSPFLSPARGTTHSTASGSTDSSERARALSQPPLPSPDHPGHFQLMNP